MERKNKFKVVISSYNNEKWVEANVASILKQTYTNYDVLYINDASTDNTLSLIHELKNNYNLNNWKIPPFKAVVKNCVCCFFFSAALADEFSMAKICF